MRYRNPNLTQRLRSGQTLIMALFVLGILLVLGFVFIAVVNQNILRAGAAQQRSVSNDLAEAGIRFAHSQLLYSVQGADWRPIAAGPINARDPDANFLALDPDANPLNGDQGGPDGLGAYTRVSFANGRALIRVRYGPSDPLLFLSQPPGNLPQPGKARSYLIIESVGKIGRVTGNDPTTVLGADRRESRKLIAFCSMGPLESGMYITNLYRESRPADIGAPPNMGARYVDQSGGGDVLVPQIMGGLYPVQDFDNPAVWNPVPLGGGLWSNAPLQIYGNLQVNLNTTLGETFQVADAMYGADSTSMLSVRKANWAAGAWNISTINLLNASNPSLDSRSSLFDTFGGALKDGFEGSDPNGYPRATQFKAPPAPFNPDPVTGRSRYDELTRLSGWLGPNGNSGRFGHGKGIYINNGQDRQMRQDEAGREDVGTAESLIYDWFNPNNGQAGSGWKGPFYVPRGAYIQLLTDGFIIQRDANATGNERTWRRPDGGNTGATQIRYRIGDPDGTGPIRTPFIVNTFTPGANINAANPNFAAGQPFNGVIEFEGNARVRGVIPTDLPITLVSKATIYIEGSITKGVVGNDWTSGDPDLSQRTAAGDRLARPSRSMAMLIARDYVAVNTPMFFGPPPGQALEEVNESPGAIAHNPVRMREAGGTLGLRFEELLDPESAGANPMNPGSWLPFVWGTDPNQGGYREHNTTNFIEPKLVLTHAMDDGPAPFTFISADVNFGIGSPANPSTLLFPMDPVYPYNSASGQGPYVPGYITPGYTTPNWIPIEGLGSETWHRYPKFESVGFPLVSDAGTSFTFPLLNLNAPQGKFRIITQETNDLGFRHNNVGGGATNDWLLSRAAVLPHDNRIEAAVFAEEGSFVVIPGNWFNPNPNDRRQTYDARRAQLEAGGMSPAQARAVADQERRENFGAQQDMPFYGEPIDVRVTILGSITQNMPLPIAQQSEWLKKWGWIPRYSGANTRLIPGKHVPAGYSATLDELYVPNLYLIYDPALSTGRAAGFDLPSGSDTSKYIRRDDFGRPLPPMPRLPVSPTLSYFGEVQP